MADSPGQKETTFDDLPTDVVALILKQVVAMSGALQCARVCKRFHIQIKTNKWIHAEGTSCCIKFPVPFPVVDELFRLIDFL